MPWYVGHVLVACYQELVRLLWLTKVLYSFMQCFVESTGHRLTVTHLTSFENTGKNMWPVKKAHGSHMVAGQKFAYSGRAFQLQILAHYFHHPQTCFIVILLTFHAGLVLILGLVQLVA